MTGEVNMNYGAKEKNSCVCDKNEKEPNASCLSFLIPVCSLKGHFYPSTSPFTPSITLVHPSIIPPHTCCWEMDKGTERVWMCEVANWLPGQEERREERQAGSKSGEKA